MSTVSLSRDLPQGFHLLEEPGFASPDAADRPNRLCICFSDVHFTDGTVGRQSADDVVWEEVFDQIMDQCVDYGVEELTLLVVGDVADMIRTAQWAKHGVYPWQRDHPEFKPILREIMRGIIGIHARGPDPAHPCRKTGFFYLLKQLPEALRNYDYQNAERSERKQSLVKRIRTLVFLGNHDKEIVADDETLKMYYEECLGHTFGADSKNPLTDEYRRWIGKMYFGDETRFLDPESVPWLPFYWGDRGFRLFVTHGQWRDEDNSRRIDTQAGQGGWQVADGWNPARWRELRYAPFTEPCFGDSVAAGVLSGFIYRSKQRLQALPVATPQQREEIDRLTRILDELDLYRPTYAAVARIIKETWRLRTLGEQLVQARDIIESELRDSIHQWLDWDFTVESARPPLRFGLRIARVLVSMMKRLGARIELGFLYVMMRGMTWLKEGIFRFGDAPSYREMQRFPAFLAEYRDYGFRIHGEGHTHIPLQEELYFREPQEPADRKSYSYINFGTWRDQIVTAQKRKYRRRGVGRALCVLDLLPDSRCGEDGQRDERLFAYWVEDILAWGDNMDRL